MEPTCQVTPCCRRYWDERYLQQEGCEHEDDERGLYWSTSGNAVGNSRWSVHNESEQDFQNLDPPDVAVIDFSRLVRSLTHQR